MTEDHLDFESKGLKIYYSKIKAGIVMAVFFILFVSQLIFCIVNKYELMFVATFLYLIFIFRGLSYYLYKKPVFIYYSGNLFYKDDSIKYNFENYIFEVEIVSKYNYSQSICIYDLGGNRLVIENLWYIKNNWEIDDIVKKMKLLRLLKIKDEKMKS